ncbi:MAG: hypothetical protein SGI83_01075 [Bacteroidota bacterium]|nr:hypothetical protein [Bacteroidota bacterium]
MRKAYIIFCSLFIIYSCNSSEEKDNPTLIPKEKAVQSAADMDIQAWLQGKVWTAENDNAPMSLLKLKSDGYELKSGKNPGTWKIIAGEIDLDGLTEWPLEKIDDTSFRIYVKPTDKWYIYKQTSSL